MAAKWGPNVLFCMPIRTKWYPVGFKDGCFWAATPLPDREPMSYSACQAGPSGILLVSKMGAFGLPHRCQIGSQCPILHAKQDQVVSCWFQRWCFWAARAAALDPIDVWILLLPSTDARRFSACHLQVDEYPLSVRPHVFVVPGSRVVVLAGHATTVYAFAGNSLLPVPDVSVDRLPLGVTYPQVKPRSEHPPPYSISLKIVTR
jgi:hypothetical protein